MVERDCVGIDVPVSLTYARSKLYVGGKSGVFDATADSRRVLALKQFPYQLVSTGDGRALIVSEGKKVHVFDLSAEKIRSTWATTGREPSDVASGPAGLTLVVGSDEAGRFAVHDQKKKAPRFTGAGLRYARAAWVDGERFVSVAALDPRSLRWFAELRGTNGTLQESLGHLGSLGTELHPVVVSARRRVFTVTKQGLVELLLKPLPSKTPAATGRVLWAGGAIFAAQPGADGLVLATSKGVFSVGLDGGAESLSNRRATAIAATKDRVAFIHRPINRQVPSKVFELTR